MRLTLSPPPKAGLWALFFSLLLLPLTTQAAKVTPIFVVMGGFNACEPAQEGAAKSPEGMPLAQLFYEVQSALVSEKQIQPKYLLACFGVSQSSSSLSRRAIDLRVSTSAGKSIQIAVENIDPESPIQAHTFDAALDVLEKEIRALIDSPSVIYLVGHSYGGWSAMKLGLRLSEPAKKLPFTLMTIDPISPLACNPLKYAEAMLATVRGCQEAPADIDSAQRTTLIQSTNGRWKHYYETQFHRLHSSSIPELGEGHMSVRLRVESPSWLFNNQHSDIYKEARVVDFLKKLAIRDAESF